jgi:hypothetical protein
MLTYAETGSASVADRLQCLMAWDYGGMSRYEGGGGGGALAGSLVHASTIRKMSDGDLRFLHLLLEMEEGEEHGKGKGGSASR